MIDQKRIGKLYPHILGLFSAVFLLTPHYTTMAILGWIVFLIISGISKSLQFNWNWKSALWIGFYLLYVIGSFFTNHEDLAGKYLEYKLSFIIFPLLFSFQPKAKFEISQSFLWFIGALTVLTTMNFIHSFSCGMGRSCFLSSQFSYSHHPTYFSAFHFFAITIIVFGYQKNWKYFNPKWIIPFLALSIISQLLALSLAGILILSGFIMSFILYHIYKKWRRNGILVGFIAVPLLFFLFLSETPQIAGDWNAAKKYLNEYISEPSTFVKSRTYPFSGTEVRLVMWTAAFQTMMKYPFGVGTGNVDEFLGAQLRDLDQNSLAEQNYNPHNQFLQIAIEIGFFGLVFFFLMLFYFVRVAWKTKNFILLFLVVSLFFNSLFESMLQRQSGIVFYTFWICILIQHTYLEKKTSTEGTLITIRKTGQ